MRVIPPLLAFLLLAVTRIAAAPPAVQQELTAKVLQAMGITSGIHRLPAMIDAGLASGVAARDPTADMTVRLCKQAFDPPRMLSETTEYLAARATPEQLLSYLELAATPLYSKMTALQLDAAKPAAGQAVMDFTRSLALAPPQEHRLAQVRRLAQVEGGAELQVELQVRIFRAVVQGVANANPGLLARSPKSPEAAIAEMQSRLREPLIQQHLSTILYAYRNCTDDELERYIAALARPPIPDVFRLCKEAVLHAFEIAASEVGREAAKLAPATQP